ncbi:MAG: O-antigen ligase family protein [Candidatus Omnitrophota bacterium]
MILGLGAFAGSLAIVKRIGAFPLFCILVFIYWLPLDSRLRTFSPVLGELYLTELGIWVLFLGMLVHRGISRNIQDNASLNKFLFLPFLFFIGGALLTYSVTEYNGESSLTQIRFFCILPALFYSLCLYLIKTVRQAERLLWVFLISAGLLGLIFLYAPQLPTYEFEILHAELLEKERMMKIIKVPLCNVLFMGSEVTPINYAFIAALAFNFWLNHPSFWKRLLASGLLLISALVIIKAQGRMGLVASAVAVTAITTLTVVGKKYSPASFTKTLWKIGIAVFILFFGFWYYANISTGVVQQRVLETFADPSQAPGLADRFWRWKESFLVVLKHPFFGVGPEGFQKFGYIHSWFAHNLYLYLWLSFGISGLIGFLWIFVRFTKACWVVLRPANSDCQILAIGGIACVIVLLAAGITSSTFMISVWQSLMFWIPFGTIFAAANLRGEH